LHPIPDNTQDLLKQRPIITHLHLEYLETNNQLRNRSLEKRHHCSSKPINNSTNSSLNSRPNSSNNRLPQLSLREKPNQSTNQQHNASNNQANRISPHRSVQQPLTNRSRFSCHGGCNRCRALRYSRGNI